MLSASGSACSANDDRFRGTRSERYMLHPSDSGGGAREPSSAGPMLGPSHVQHRVLKTVLPWTGVHPSFLGSPHPRRPNMPSTPSLGRWQVKSDRRFLTTTEVLPSSDWCSKQVIQVVAATSQRLSRRQQNRIRFDQ